MDARWILVILLLPLVSGCTLKEVLDEKLIPDPKEGDLILTINMRSRSTYSVEEIRNRTSGSKIIIVDITLENVCEHTVAVDGSFSIGTSLHPRSYAEDGTEVEISYPLSSREVFYERFKPGEKMTCHYDLSGDESFLMIHGKRQAFGWTVPGRYNLTVSWWGARTSLEVISNTLEFQLL